MVRDECQHYHDVSRPTLESLVHTVAVIDSGYASSGGEAFQIRSILRLTKHSPFRAAKPVGKCPRVSVALCEPGFRQLIAFVVDGIQCMSGTNPNIEVICPPIRHQLVTTEAWRRPETATTFSGQVVAFSTMPTNSIRNRDMAAVMPCFSLQTHWFRPPDPAHDAGQDIRLGELGLSYFRASPPFRSSTGIVSCPSRLRNWFFARGQNFAPSVWSAPLTSSRTSLRTPNDSDVALLRTVPPVGIVIQIPCQKCRRKDCAQQPSLV